MSISKTLLTGTFAILLGGIVTAASISRAEQPGNPGGPTQEGMQDGKTDPAMPDAKVDRDGAGTPDVAAPRDASRTDEPKTELQGKSDPVDPKTGKRMPDVASPPIGGGNPEPAPDGKGGLGGPGTKTGDN
jgi:hypothetical protein